MAPSISQIELSELATEIRLAIVIPVLNDGPSVHRLLSDLSAVTGKPRGSSIFVIVDDGSVPHFEFDASAAGADIPVMTLRLHRNVGHQSAIAIGVAYVSATMPLARIVVMDGDGEDDPGDVPRLLETLALDPMGVVVAERTKRSEGLMFRVLYRIYRSVFLALSGKEIRFGNFSALGPSAARRLVHMNELYLSFPATLIRSGLAIKRIKTNRALRYAGVSKMNFAMLVAHAIAGLACLLDRVMSRLLIGAVALASFATVVFLFALSLKLFGHATPGWLTVVASSTANLVVTSLLILLLGLILGIYQRLAMINNPATTHAGLIERVTCSPVQR